MSIDAAIAHPRARARGDAAPRPSWLGRAATGAGGAAGAFTLPLAQARCGAISQAWPRALVAREAAAEAHRAGGLWRAAAPGAGPPHGVRGGSLKAVAERRHGRLKRLLPSGGRVDGGL